MLIGCCSPSARSSPPGDAVTTAPKQGPARPEPARTQTPVLVVIARLLDRIGKGIRGAPRDALVADVAPPEIRGACYGLRQSMDTVGAVAGPVAAMLLMFWFADRIRAVLWFAVLPSLMVIALWCSRFMSRRA